MRIYGFLSAAMLLLGCAGDEVKEQGGQGGGQGAKTIQFAVRFVDATAKTTRYLEGVEVCAAERPDVECVTSDAEGRIAMALPARSELMVRCQSGTHGPMYMTWEIGDDDIDAGTFSLLDSGTEAVLVTLSGAKEWPAKGGILANVYDDLGDRTRRVEGATFTITPRGPGPTYVSAERKPDASLVASTQGGPALFYDLDPGEVTVTIAHPTRSCTGGFGWRSGSPDALGSKIFAGGLSSVTFVCPP